ncbi:MAG: 3-oxoacyl-[acyl-carrier-protein] reductase [Candidatus Omnitrophica bacterium]|nr:3-oxoacyl-[acyl-carrier-protein] reductase [Candidatus Omnitrophota bacterium]
MKLKNRVAIVTGGARGIGNEIALALAKEGADIALCDVDQQALARAMAQIEALSRKCDISVVDVGDYACCENMVNKTLDKFGRVDILINNAGITRDSLLMRMKEEDWDAVLRVNLKGAFNFTKAVCRPMVKQRFGKIVNIASIIGIMGNAGQANYAASKAGLIGLTKSSAKELASRGINVNAIAPGFIKTSMTDKLTDEQKTAMLKLIPMNSLGSPADVANLALFLVSDSSSYITGEVIKVDGGMVM